MNLLNCRRTLRPGGSRILALAYSEQRSQASLLVDQEIRKAESAQGVAAAEIFALLLEVASELGHVRAATTLLPRAAEMSCPFVGQGDTSRDLVLGEAHKLLGDFQQARALLESALQAAIRIKIRPSMARAHLSLAEVLLEQGRHAKEAQLPAERVAELNGQAHEHLDAAILDFRAMKMQPFLERALRHKGLLHA